MILEAAKRAALFAFERFNSVLIISIVALLVQIPSFYGEDIVNARKNFQYGSKIDFWGGMSSLVYAHVPNFGIRWQIWLAIFQITLTYLALNKILPNTNQTKKSTLAKYLAIYSAITFSSQMTRDGLMFSLLIFGFAKLISNLSKKSSSKSIPIIWPLLIVSIGMSFRPWLSVAILPMIFVTLKMNQIKISRLAISALIVFVTLSPLIFELTATKALKLNKGFPQQQVMMMDAAATYCYTTNVTTGEIAKKALQVFSEDPDYTKIVCQLFRPDTWLSLTKAINTSSVGFDVNFNLIYTTELLRYKELESKWINFIVRDPVTYLQNKILFGTKLFIGSDSRNLTILSADSLAMGILGFYRLPYDVAVTLHFFSFAFCTFMLLLIPIVRSLRNKNTEVLIDQFTIFSLLSIFLWTSLSAIAYLGSNGRYTYSLSILIFILYISRNRIMNFEKNE
jgi:hypothetical protein